MDAVKTMDVSVTGMAAPVSVASQPIPTKTTPPDIASTVTQLRKFASGREEPSTGSSADPQASEPQSGQGGPNAYTELPNSQTNQPSPTFETVNVAQNLDDWENSSLGSGRSETSTFSSIVTRVTLIETPSVSNIETVQTMISHNGPGTASNLDAAVALQSKSDALPGAETAPHPLPDPLTTIKTATVINGQAQGSSVTWLQAMKSALAAENPDFEVDSTVVNLAMSALLIETSMMPLTVSDINIEIASLITGATGQTCCKTSEPDAEYSSAITTSLDQSVYTASGATETAESFTLASTTSVAQGQSIDSSSEGASLTAGSANTYITPSLSVASSPPVQTKSIGSTTVSRPSASVASKVMAYWGLISGLMAVKLLIELNV